MSWNVEKKGWQAETALKEEWRREGGRLVVVWERKCRTCGELRREDQESFDLHEEKCQLRAEEKARRSRSGGGSGER